MADRPAAFAARRGRRAPSHARAIGRGLLTLGLLLGLLPRAPVWAGEIRLVGSDLLGPNFGRALAEFARQNDFAVKPELHGTRPGLDELAAGRADVGLFLLPLGETPAAAGLTSRIIGYQVAVVAVPAASPLTQATAAQLRGIFSGNSGDAFTRWGELNLIGAWTSRPITLCALSPSAGLAFPLFRQAILTGAAARPGLEFAATPEDFSQRLRAADNSIGVTGLPAAEVPGLRILALAAGPSDPAYAPTSGHVHSGNYPLRMPLYVAFRRAAAPELQLFLKFLLSDEAAAALIPAHCLPLPPDVRNQLVFELEEMR